ncbi:feather beta keratin-like [Zonotrichia leucophrys gambelii]|uniref:feather beta keratin-like n=1 Tax=Zonotrichia leucophrys gambelii TaxID=257770 RepID=UPI003140A9D8
MACNSLCRPCGPTPLANSCNEPCALQCQDSRVIINPSPVLVTLPGPIMTSFPQNTAVGSTSSAAVGTELSVQGQPISGDLVALVALAMAVDLAMGWEAWAAMAEGAMETSAKGPQHQP